MNFHQQTNDEQLFCYLKNDDPLAFKELYNRYWSFLLDSACRTLQSQDRAEDVVQEIFISLYQRRKDITLEVSLKAYLCKALKFKVLNELRSKTVRDNYQKRVFFQSGCKNDFVVHSETKELKSAIDQSVEQLPEKCKQAFLLSREENLSYKDISDELEISVSTVEKHISKALKSIRGNLSLYL